MKTTCSIYPQPYHSLGNVLKVETVFFEFEADFVEDNVRCIPMIVRFKLDACGIKLKLSEWSKMSIDERSLLSEMVCSTLKEILQYRHYLQQLVIKHAGIAATYQPVEPNPAWANTNELPPVLIEKLAAFNWPVSLQQWQRLSNLQRFVLLKLCKPGHENKNFPKAYKEFGLV